MNKMYFNMEYKNLDLAKKYFDNGDYLKAYEAYREITLNVSLTDNLRSDAYYMLGLLSSPFFLSSPDGESEVKYYERALRLNPFNINALSNVVELYNPNTNNLKLGQHQGKKIFAYAYEIAIGILDKFTRRQSDIIEQKYQYYLSIKNEERRKNKKQYNTNRIPEIKAIKYTKQRLIECANQTTEFKFLFFWGHHPKRLGVVDKSCLSQWYPSVFFFKNNTYHTAEHWMMAEKARLFNDQEMVERILKATTPKEAKLLGRKVNNFDEYIWDKHKLSIVIRGNFLKFSQDSQLQNFLLGTEDDILVEASPYDSTWGIGMGQDEEGTTSPQNWKGENLLGFALMEVRGMLQSYNVRV